MSATGGAESGRLARPTTPHRLIETVVDTYLAPAHSDAPLLVEGPYLAGSVTIDLHPGGLLARRRPSGAASSDVEVSGVRGSLPRTVMGEGIRMNGKVAAASLHVTTFPLGARRISRAYPGAGTAVGLLGLGVGVVMSLDGHGSRDRLLLTLGITSSVEAALLLTGILRARP